MKPSGSRPGRPATLLGLGLALLAPLAGQNRLYVLEPDGNYHAVVKVAGSRPVIMEQDRPVPAKGDRFALRKVEEYVPIFINVLAKEAGSAAMIPLTSGPSVPALLNNEFHFSAKLVSSSRLEDVFLVVALESSNMGRNYLTCEVGVLEAWTPKPVAVDMPLERSLGAGKFSLLLFVGGAEVFSSEQPAAEREALLTRMIAKRIAGVPKAGPRPFFGLEPEYPAALRQTGLKGEVVVAMLISPAGTVQDPVVESATHPAFGAAALAVVRQWRFLPRMEAGRAVETRVKLPLVFDPPDETAARKS